MAAGTQAQSFDWKLIGAIAARAMAGDEQLIHGFLLIPI